MRLNKKILLTLGAGLLAANPLVAAESPRGNLIELHSCELYAGGCTVSAEASQGGRYMLQIWDVSSGSWQGVDLAGLKAAVFYSSTDNLAEAGTRADRAVVYLPQSATAQQRTALLAWLRSQKTSLAATRAETRVVPIIADTSGERVTFKAGDFASLQAVPLAQCVTRACGEDLWYEPRAETTAFTVAANADSRVIEPSLHLTWSDNNRRSVFVARFGEPTPAKNLFVTATDWCGPLGRLF